MQRFILEVVIFTVISMICFSVFGQPVQDWQDEEHIWNEDKGEWEIHTKDSALRMEKDKREGIKSSYTEEWARYLPKSVRSGKRWATEKEIERAQEKLWIKEMMTVRAMKKAEDRRQLIKYRKATGWYGARRSGSHARGLSWPMQMHVRAVGNHLGY